MDNIERRNNNLAYRTDEKMFEEAKRTRRLLYKFNMTCWDDFTSLKEIIKELFAKVGSASITPPFFCDYGSNIEVGMNFYANSGCTILDVAKVKIGDNCLFGPHVSIFTAGHPIYPSTRNSGYEYGKEIIIGDNVWIGGGAIVCPGVTIGSNVVIGAGSVVTKDMPSWTVCAGNPCKVLRMITKEDERKLFKDEDIDEEAWNNIIEGK